MGILHTPHLRITLETLAASLLDWRAGSLRSFTTIRKEAGLFCGSFLRKGEVSAYVVLSQNFKELKALLNSSDQDYFERFWRKGSARALETHIDTVCE